MLAPAQRYSLMSVSLPSGLIGIRTPHGVLPVMGCCAFVAMANVLFCAFVSSGIQRRSSIVGHRW